MARTPSHGASENPLELSGHFDGANAHYLEQQYTRYKNNDPALGESWRDYFARLENGAEGGAPDVMPQAPSWQRADWPPVVNGEMTAVLDGNWPADTPNQAELGDKIAARMTGADEQAVRAATLDSVRAIMMIRAYRLRGHLAAD